MAVSERSLDPYIKGLVEENGALTVTELNELLRGILVLDAQDLTILAGRNDDKFSQIVRNVVAHAPEGVSCRHGYIIDKTRKPAVFYAKARESENAAEAVVSEEDIRERREKHRRVAARKVNFAEVNEGRSALGKAGESFAAEWERRRLRELGVTFDVSEEVVHVYSRYGDGAGYDILSRRDGDFGLLYIEVKTTKGGADTPFYLSENERAFLEIYSENAVIYRVYDFDPETNVGEVRVITYEELAEGYAFAPVSYRVEKNS